MGDQSPEVTSRRVDDRWGAALPLALLALCLLSFGLLAPHLGFYWDDWPTIWFLHFFGPQSFHHGFAEDRPWLAWVFQASTSLLGEWPLAWQFFGIFTRWLYSLSYWWVLRLIWPQAPRQIAWAALLFAVYPAFRQQYISVTYSNGELVLSLFLVSLAMMILAVRSSDPPSPPVRRYLLLGAALASSAISLFITEYVFGLELLRPLILWLLQPGRALPWRQRLRKVLSWWLPFLAVLLAFLVWRLFLHTTPRGTIILFELLRQAPLTALSQLALTIGNDLYEVSLLAWIKALDIRPLLTYGPPQIGLFVGVLLAAGLGAFLWLGKAAASDTPASRSWALQAVLLGAAALLLAGWPIWVTNLHMELKFPHDRFYLPMLFGAALLITGLLHLFSKYSHWLTPLALSLLLGVAASLHFRDALVFRQDWLRLQDFLWQLSWRAPGLQPGTALLTSKLPFRFSTDNSITAPINWMYDPQLSSTDMAYMVYDLESRLGGWLPNLEPGTAIQQPYRVTSFTGSTSQAIVLFYNPPRCLKVMDPILDRNLPYKPDYLAQAVPLSNLELILPAGQAQPPPFFGPEPAPNWCYYYQKAELAVQIGDWQQAAAYGDQASKAGLLGPGRTFTRETALELIPFIRGYALSGRLELAMQLTRQAYQASDPEKARSILCNTWELIRRAAPADASLHDAFGLISSELECTNNP